MKVEEGKGEGGDGDPPKPPPYPPSTYGSSFSHDEKKKQPTQFDPNAPLLKLDVKFELPMYSNELNVEKLNNWLKQIEVYYKIQQIV